MIQREARMDRWILALIILFGAALRFYDLGRHSLWFDELQQASVASLPATEFWSAIKLQLAPPLDYILLKLLFLTGWRSDFWARFAAASFSTASLFMIYRLGKVAFNKRVGLLAATFLAVSLFSIKYAQEARMYSFFMFLTIGSALSLFRFIESRTLLNAVTLGVLNGLALLTQYFALWSVFSQGLLLAYLSMRGQLGKRGTLLAAASFGVSFLIFLPWLPTFLTHVRLTQGGVHYAQKTSLTYLFHMLDIFSSGKRETLVILPLFIKGWGEALQKRQRAGSLLGWLFVAGLAVALLYALYRPTLTDRNLIFLLPFFLIGVAAGLDHLLWHFRLHVVVGVVGIVVFASTHLVRFHRVSPNAWKYDWHAVAETIQATGGADERVLVMGPGSRLGVGYYLCPGTVAPMPLDFSNAPDKRIWILDEGLVKQLSKQAWSGWLLLEFGVNRPGHMDRLVESFQATLPPAVKLFYSPNAGNGLALYHLLPKSSKHP